MSTKDYYDGNFKPNKSPIAPNELCAAEDIMMQMGLSHESYSSFKRNFDDCLDFFY